MRHFASRRARLVLPVMLMLTLVPLSAAAQTSSGSSGSSQTTTTQTTRTVETSQPQVTVTRTVTRGVDPMWLGLGAVVLVALLAILFLATRGRSHTHTAVVHDRETVVRRE